MDDLIIKGRMNLPITTGIATEVGKAAASGEKKSNLGFKNILEDAIGRELSFSKHAAQRVSQREIEISSLGMQRLDDGMRIAKNKGMENALILVDNTAFIVSTRNSKIITAINSLELKGKAITNIDGTVII